MKSLVLLFQTPNALVAGQLMNDRALLINMRIIIANVHQTPVHRLNMFQLQQLPSVRSIPPLHHDVMKTTRCFASGPNCCSSNVQAPHRPSTVNNQGQDDNIHSIIYYCNSKTHRLMFYIGMHGKEEEGSEKCPGFASRCCGGSSVIYGRCRIGIVMRYWEMKNIILKLFNMILLVVFSCTSHGLVFFSSASFIPLQPMRPNLNQPSLTQGYITTI